MTDKEALRYIRQRLKTSRWRDVAAEIGVKEDALRKWAARKTVPRWHLPAIEAARARAIEAAEARAA